jgi:opacity protein-like surface antigen
MRRHTVILAGCLLTIAGAAHAQTSTSPAAAPPDRGYIEAIAESAISHVTSQAFGAEVGVTVRPDLQIFGSFGQVRDTTTPELSAGAQTIAAALAQVQTGAVTYSVKQPVTFFLGGVRYRFKTASKLMPYISGGLGIATVKKDVNYQIGGVDASSTLSQYVTLGSDISGDESKVMFSLGAGAVYPVWQQLIIDLQYQFNHIASDTAVTVNRIGLGVGVRF